MIWRKRIFSWGSDFVSTHALSPGLGQKSHLGGQQGHVRTYWPWDASWNRRGVFEKNEPDGFESSCASVVPGWDRNAQAPVWNICQQCPKKPFGPSYGWETCSQCGIFGLTLEIILILIYATNFVWSSPTKWIAATRIFSGDKLWCFAFSSGATLKSDKIVLRYHILVVCPTNVTAPNRSLDTWHAMCSRKRVDIVVSFRFLDRWIASGWKFCTSTCIAPAACAVRYF